MTREEQAQYIAEKLMENPEFRKVFVGAITDAANEAVKVIKALQQEHCEMTAEEYRQRMIQAFHNADCDELIAICVLPTEKEFEHLEWLLEKHYKAKPEPCGDAISREDALMALTGEYTDSPIEILPKAIKRINKLPPVTPTEKVEKWIPVSERLPEADEYVGDVAKYYLVQNEYGDMLVARYTHGEYWEQMYQLKPIGDEIVAWMTLPLPWKASPTNAEEE